MQDDETLDVMVNGVSHQVTVPARRTLADLLRDDLGLTGTHLGCEHGVCGACTVLVDGEAVRACLVFAPQVDGAEVTTVEGLAGDDDRLSALQAAFSEERALQCGYCTPGFLMLAEDHLRRSGSSDEGEVRTHVSSNLCRCTGYAGIVDAVCSAAQQRMCPVSDGAS
ncbi:MAG: (2Fe-2S)-binding protein [Nitriliruptoraceae bacterium]|nr:(2Fe-2S)-binding protein [Nitriliruptoraceae bacterium]